MNFSGDYQFQERIEKIWEYLNDPKVLKDCIEGCEEFTAADKNNFF